MTFGSYTVYPLESGRFRLDGGSMFGVVPKTLWSKAATPDESNRIHLAMRTLLLISGERRILVDTGIGHKTSEKFNSIYGVDFSQYRLEQSLAARGYYPENITDVILTHLHFDHCGGSVASENGNLRLAFPNAQYYVQRAHWDWANKPSLRDRASFLPDDFIPLMDAGRLHLLEGPEELFPGLHLVIVNGHTFAQQLVKLVDGERSLLYCGDLVPTHVHIPAPYIMGYDLQPLVTLQEKLEILQAAADSGTVLLFEHDPTYEAAMIASGEKGFSKRTAGTLEGIFEQS